MFDNFRFTYFNLKRVLISIVVFFFIMLLIIFPKSSVDSSLAGLNIWFNVVFPSLLPFFIGSHLLIKLGFVNFLGIVLEPLSRRIFNVSGQGSFAIIMGFTSGYPTGAKIVSQLFSNKLCTKSEAERLLAFTNNSGPLFILGAVAVGMFHSPSIGILLALSHYLAAITIGIILKYFNNDKYKKINIAPNKIKTNSVKEKNLESFGGLLGDCIEKSMNTLLVIGGFIILFSVVVNLLNQIGIITTLTDIIHFYTYRLNINKEIISAFISGFFEITSGCNMISKSSAPYMQKMIATSMILGWSGICVHLQVISIISKTTINYLTYIQSKFWHSIISGVYTYILLSLPIKASYMSVFSNDYNIYYGPLNMPLKSLIINSIIVFCIFVFGFCAKKYFYHKFS